MILKLTGLVEMGDPCRVDNQDQHGAITIGGTDLIGEIDSASFEKHVTVGIMDERFEGELSVETGWGYSEFTPYTLQPSYQHKEVNKYAKR
ncbi:hypothetical protein MHI27_11830 [Paenibacillus sp. FSL H8-0261]|uniref:hypothetical protein n=1 Tax=Paenibacillus sp. FSL H8-0261 TaxID=2921381 RepID=UPI0032439EF6